METKRMTQKAWQIAGIAFAGMTDRANVPYINHIDRVFFGVDSKNHEDWVIAILHDLVEDTDWTLSDLRGEGFSDYVVSGVDAITKRDGEHYRDYLKRVRSHEGARLVKLADIKHNSDLSRLPEVRQADTDRINKYKKATRYLNYEF